MKFRRIPPEELSSSTPVVLPLKPKATTLPLKPRTTSLPLKPEKVFRPVRLETKLGALVTQDELRDGEYYSATVRTPAGTLKTRVFEGHSLKLPKTELERELRLDVVKKNTRGPVTSITRQDLRKAHRAWVFLEEDPDYCFMVQVVNPRKWPYGLHHLNKIMGW